MFALGEKTVNQRKHEIVCKHVIHGREGLNGWWLLRLSPKILALLRLSVNFLQLRLTIKSKINFLCFKKLNIN